MTRATNDDFIFCIGTNPVLLPPNEKSRAHPIEIWGTLGVGRPRKGEFRSPPGPSDRDPTHRNRHNEVLHFCPYVFSKSNPQYITPPT